MTSGCERDDRDQAQDVEFMLRPQSWPTWPFLSIVRRDDGGERHLAVLADGKDGLLLIEPANIYFALADALADPGRRRPADVAKLVDDGWKVD